MISRSLIFKALTPGTTGTAIAQDVVRVKPLWNCAGEDQWKEADARVIADDEDVKAEEGEVPVSDLPSAQAPEAPKPVRSL